MKKVIQSFTTAALALTLIFSSCTKFDFKPGKGVGGGKFPIISADCDVQRVYTHGEAGQTNVEMQKMYNRSGRVVKIGFYTYSGLSEDKFWHSFSLTYNASDWSIDIIDSASGAPELKAIFNHSGRLDTLRRLHGETSEFADRTFDYEGGRLVRILSRWRIYDMVESFTYDTEGNITRREVGDDSGITEASVFTYSASAAGRKQFYMPQYNYMIVTDPSMVLLEYLGWIDDFSPKNILTNIEYLAPLPHDDIFNGHAFASGKLASYSNGNWVGGKKYIDWRCGCLKF